MHALSTLLKATYVTYSSSYGRTFLYTGLRCELHHHILLRVSTYILAFAHGDVSTIVLSFCRVSLVRRGRTDAAVAVAAAAYIPALDMYRRYVPVCVSLAVSSPKYAGWIYTSYDHIQHNHKYQYYHRYCGLLLLSLFVCLGGV